MRDELEKILNELMGHDDGVEFGNGYHDECKQEIQEALTSIINLVDKEIIGEDEYFEKNLFKREDDDVPKYFRNKLRASQRAKLKGVRL